METSGLLLVLKNISNAYGDIFTFINGTAYVLGALSAFFGMTLLYRAGEPGSRGRESSTAWVWSFLAAVVFFSLPSFMESSGRQIFGEGIQTNPMAYESVIKTEGELAPLVGFLQILGFCFSMRGLWVLRAVGIHGNHSQGGASFGKGAVMVIAGILLVHLKDFLGVLSSLTGLNLGAGLF